MSTEIVKDEIEAKWNAAASTWDVQALARLYTRDAVFFGLLPKLYIGRSEVERYFSTYRAALRGVTLSLVEQEIRVLAPEAFAAQGFGDLLNYRSIGDVQPNRVRTSLVVVRADGQWRISLHHFSQIPDSAA